MRLLGLLAGLSLAACRSENAHPWSVAAVDNVPDSTLSIVRFTNGRTLRLPLRDVTIHGSLAGTDSVPLLVISGWGCKDCDIEEQIFLLRADTTLGKEYPPHYAYPGSQYVDVEDSASFQSRVFFGDCLRGRPGVAVWLYRSKDSAGVWRQSVFIRTQNASWRDSTKKLIAETLTAVTAATSAGRCREIVGKEQRIF